MPAVESVLRTPRADRYLAQLTSHLAHGPGGLQVLSSADDQLIVDLGPATWTIRATPDALVLRVEAEDPTDVEQQSTRVAHRIEQIARRDALTVTWHSA